MRFILIACFAYVLSGYAQLSYAQSFALPSDATLEKLMHDGIERQYLVFTPSNLPADASIVLLLHGGSQSMRKLLLPTAGGTQAWPELARKERFVLVVPNAVNPQTGDPASDLQTWNVQALGYDNTVRASQVDDVGFILKALDQTIQRLSAQSIKPKHVYVTGVSNGGMMTFRLLIEAPQRFTAGAAFIASGSKQGSQTCPA